MGAAQAPVDGGDAFDEGLLDEPLGIELVDEVGEEAVELADVFAAVALGDDALPGKQAVLEGVPAGASFTLEGSRAGGFAGILAVGGDLGAAGPEGIARIDATDREIDQLVYELYGLTDDEIRIVEEATQ